MKKYFHPSLRQFPHFTISGPVIYYREGLGLQDGWEAVKPGGGGGGGGELFSEVFRQYSAILLCFPTLRT